MRTTVTIEDDLAKALAQMQRENEATFKETLNQVLRAGLRQLPKNRGPRRPIR